MRDYMTASGKIIKVLVVDDSALMRKMVGDIVAGTPGLELAGTANDGVECLAQVRKLRPDVVTLDIEMPNMDGLQALAQLMKDDPVAVLILSAHAVEGAEATLLALELGGGGFHHQAFGIDLPGHRKGPAAAGGKNLHGGGSGPGKA
jgi:chemotaxis response regulator CheB